MLAIKLVPKTMLQMMDLAQDDQCVVDSFPIPVVEIYLVPSSTSDWEAHGARFGKVAPKKETILGCRLHLLITLNSLILDFELAPANAPDLTVGEELLASHTGLDVVGDKGYISAEVVSRLLRRNSIRLITLPQRNQKRQPPDVLEHLINLVRQIIETVNGQLAGQFDIERTYAHSFRGLCARLYAKSTAHTLCIYINRMFGKPDFLQIRSLAFPNL